MERMSALDAEFLYLEDGVNHLHIGACLIFEGPCPTKPDVRGVFAAALPNVPRYRQRVRTVPLALGRPVWEDDPEFDLDNHLFWTTVPEVGDEAALQALTAELMSMEIDRRHPLWETWVVDGLPDDRWAMVAKVHHCMVDGVAGVDLLAAILSDSPEVVIPATVDDRWEPAPGPSNAELVLDAVGELVRPLAAVARAAVEAVRRPVDAMQDARTIASGVRSWLGGSRPTPPTPVSGPIGPERSWTWAQAGLDEAKAIRAARGGTVNDVVLAAVTNGFRDLLLARGEDPREHRLHTLVPVSVRTEHGVFDNETSAQVAELPVAIAVPELRYEVVCSESLSLKGSDEAEAGERLTALAEYIPAPLIDFGSRAFGAVLRNRGQRNVNTVTTNVPGPPFPLYAGGRRMLTYYPYVPVAFGVRYAVAVVSYDGELYFGLTGDREASPDLDVLAKGIEAGFAELAV